MVKSRRRNMSNASDDDDQRLLEFGGELPSATSDLKELFRPSAKCGRYALYGAFFFIVIVFCWMIVFWQEAATPAGDHKKGPRPPWTPADPVFPLSVLHDMDRHANPCDNFYKFSCHGFQEHGKSPEDQKLGEWRRSWDEVARKNRRKMQQYLAADKGKAGEFNKLCLSVLEHPENSPPKSNNPLHPVTKAPLIKEGKTTTATGKVASPPAHPAPHEKTLHDLQANRKADLRALQPFFNQIDNIHDMASFMETVASLHAINVAVFFDWQILSDPLNPSRSVIRFLPGGWTLPDYFLYLSSTPLAERVRGGWEAIAAKILTVSGLSQEGGEMAARGGVGVEEGLARLVEAEDVSGTLATPPPLYLNLTQLHQLAPSLDLPTFLHRLSPSSHFGLPPLKKGQKPAEEAPDQSNILVDNPAFFQKLNVFLLQCAKRPEMDASCSIEHAKQYLRLRLTYLLGPFIDVRIEEEGSKLDRLLANDAPVEEPWERCVRATIASLPDLAGGIFIQHTMGERVKHAATQFVVKLKNAYRTSLRRLPWMSPEAKKEAIAKLDDMEIHVIGPKNPENYDDIVVQGGNVTFLSAGISTMAHVVRASFDRLSKPVDRDRWPSAVNPVSVNVFYSQELNALYIPAGILQPPFFSPSTVPAKNFGSLGAIIIQEMTHAFDERGRFYDQSRKVRDWWDDNDSAAFLHRTSCIAQLYNDLTPPLSLIAPSFDSTIQADVADVGAVQLAYQALFDGAWSRWNGGVGGVAPSTGDKQLFFVSWAQTWCTKIEQNPAVHKEPIPAAAFRAFGPLTQMPEFSRVFGCPVSSPMNPIHRCPEIW